MNYSKTLLAAICVVSGCGLSAQSLNEKELNEISKSFIRDAQTRAIQNVLTQNENIRDNALNRELQGKIDHHFSHRVDRSGSVTNQYKSGRCWMFTSLNVLRPSVEKKYELSKFEFSHNYLYFWDMMEKSNLFLENIINTVKEPIDNRVVETLFKDPVADGGVWNLYYNIGAKYGVVPQEVMPETAHSNNTGQLQSLLNEKLRREGYALREAAIGGASEKKLREMKIEDMKEVYRLLALCLGEPPTQFSWRYKNKKGEIKELKNYSPKRFYAEITPSDYSPENYIMIMNDPTRPYYQIYEIDNYRNSVEGINWTYLNLPNDEIKTAAIASIKGNEAMYTSSDVGKQYNRKSGILDPTMYDYESLLGIKLDMDKKARILTRQSGSAHAMALVGVDVDADGKPLKWEFENSWGADNGNRGYLTFTDQWFDEYIFRAVIHKKYLSPKVIKSLNQKPQIVPMWDYMF
ncbi:MAG: aminopeptidase C [Marinifilaceae bacterium]